VLVGGIEGNGMGGPCSTYGGYRNKDGVWEIIMGVNWIYLAQDREELSIVLNRGISSEA
jgi:hypothetical protein